MRSDQRTTVWKHEFETRLKNPCSATIRLPSQNTSLGPVSKHRLNTTLLHATGSPRIAWIDFWRLRGSPADFRFYIEGLAKAFTCAPVASCCVFPWAFVCGPFACESMRAMCNRNCFQCSLLCEAFVSCALSYLVGLSICWLEQCEKQKNGISLIQPEVAQSKSV